MKIKNACRTTQPWIRLSTAVLAAFLVGGLCPVLAGDREDVVALVNAYATRGDQPDAAAFRALFVAKPAVTVGEKGALSADVFFKAWADRLNEFKSIAAIRRQHITSLVVDIQANGKMAANASVLTTVVQNNAIQLADTGSVAIEAVKIGSRWKINSLRLKSDTTRLDALRLEMDGSAQ